MNRELATTPPLLPLHVFLIGDNSRAEFYDASAALNQTARVACFADVEAAIAALTDPSILPHGIMLAQSYPGQFAATAIERLRAAAPLARLIALLGNWCEGEPRSGRPLPGAVRLYWHEAAARFRREFPGWFAPHSAWSLPATATEEERLLASAAAPLPTCQGLVAISSRRPEMAQLLADACRRAGYSTVWLHPRLPAQVQGAVAAIFDGDTLDADVRCEDVRELKRLAQQVSPARVLALLNAPRTQDVRIAQSLRAEVMAKPFRVDELLWRLGSTLVGVRKPSVIDGTV